MLPKLGLAFDASDHVKLYLNGAEGYRAGGVNPIISQNPAAPPPSTRTATGASSSGSSPSSTAGKLVFNAAVFHVDWEDMQISGTPDNSALGYTTNAGDAHTEGLEAELVTRPLQGLDLSLGGSLIEAELDEPAEGGAAGQPVAAHGRRRCSSSARNSGSRSPRRSPASCAATFSTVATLSATCATVPIDFTDSYTLGNLHFGIEVGRFEVTAFWRNVSDERGELVRFTSQTFDEEGT